jgi:hypothetical protein
MGRGRLRLPKYVHHYVDRHGRPRYYVRRAGFNKVPLPGLPYSSEFMDAYQAALAGQVGRIEIGASRTEAGTVNHAIVRYLGSQAFQVLAPSTQGMRRAILERFRAEHGDKRIAKLQAEHVAKIIGPRTCDRATSWPREGYQGVSTSSLKTPAPRTSV